MTLKFKDKKDENVYKRFDDFEKELLKLLDKHKVAIWGAYGYDIYVEDENGDLSRVLW